MNQQSRRAVLVGLGLTACIAAGVAFGASDRSSGDARFVDVARIADPWFAPDAGSPVPAADVAGLTVDAIRLIDPTSLRLMASKGGVSVYRATGAPGGYPDCAVIVDPYGTSVACSPPRDLTASPRLFPSLHEGTHAITVAIGSGTVASAVADDEVYPVQNGIMIAESNRPLAEIELRDAAGEVVSRVDLAVPTR